MSTVEHKLRAIGYYSNTLYIGGRVYLNGDSGPVVDRGMYAS